MALMKKTKVPCAKSSNETMKTELCYCASGCQKVRGWDTETQFLKAPFWTFNLKLCHQFVEFLIF